MGWSISGGLYISSSGQVTFPPNTGTADKSYTIEYTDGTCTCYHTVTVKGTGGPNPPNPPGGECTCSSANLFVSDIVGTGSQGSPVPATGGTVYIPYSHDCGTLSFDEAYPYEYGGWFSLDKTSKRVVCNVPANGVDPRNFYGQVKLTGLSDGDDDCYMNIPTIYQLGTGDVYVGCNPNPTFSNITCDSSNKQACTITTTSPCDTTVINFRMTDSAGNTATGGVNVSAVGSYPFSPGTPMAAGSVTVEWWNTADASIGDTVTIQSDGICTSTSEPTTRDCEGYTYRIALTTSENYSGAYVTGYTVTATVVDNPNFSNICFVGGAQVTIDYNVTAQLRNGGTETMHNQIRFSATQMRNASNGSSLGSSTVYTRAGDAGTGNAAIEPTIRPNVTITTTVSGTIYYNIDVYYSY